MAPSRVNGVTGVCTRPGAKGFGWKVDMKSDPSSEESPAVWLAVEDAEPPELAVHIGLALLGGGRQWRAGRADRASHHHHAALERGGILVAEQQPQPGDFRLQLAGPRPVAADAGIEQLGAEVGADRARGRIGADAAERNRWQQIFHAR